MGKRADQRCALGGIVLKPGRRGRWCRMSHQADPDGAASWGRILLAIMCMFAVI
jgi:hypothetical protein